MKAIKKTITFPSLVITAIFKFIVTVAGIIIRLFFTDITTPPTSKVITPKTKFNSHGNSGNQDFVKKNSPDKFEAFRKGEAFENYVRKSLFPHERYVLVDRTHSYATNKDDFIESTLKADFKFRHKASGKEFCVEAKWRNKLFNNHVEFSNPDQLIRYKFYGQQQPLYIVIGLGGTADHPSEIFMEDVDKLNSYKIPARDLARLNFNSQMNRYMLY